MFLEIIVFMLVLVAVHWWEYRTSVQEYTFTQPATLDKHSELSSLLQEKTPIAVEIGTLPWRPAVLEHAHWTIVTPDGGVRASEWLTSQKPIENGSEIAEELQFTTGLADLDSGRPWWWLPGLRGCTVDVLHHTGEQEQGQGAEQGADQGESKALNESIPLTWVTAERRWIGCTHGDPVTVWLVHSRYRRFLPETDSNANIHPWTLTVSEAPWIGRVQYVEVTVKPGWCLGLPAQWGFAATATTGDSWIWIADQHSAASLVATATASATGTQ